MDEGWAQRLTSPRSKDVGKTAQNAAPGLDGERRYVYRSIVSTAHVAPDRSVLQHTTSVHAHAGDTAGNARDDASGQVPQRSTRVEVGFQIPRDASRSLH